MVALNKAEREGIIIKNPGKDIDHKLKPHAKESTRCYLTLEEVKKIIDTPYWPKNDVKPAFLFCLSAAKPKTMTAYFLNSQINPVMPMHALRLSSVTPA